ncbi:MAG: TrpB-like pyridoxal phosphate-dependent enzyme [Candidatus Bipolaricaulota bacterium]|nr:TrpB-like pyridoxal phosphate-dependent enzyme [Candidatus Bipolaricaulota bacterium]MCX7844543.1 TrpB-like pyridoxal phosphate-dependent enzyme [Candidatus Bipolaricaulota bacterium]MDW8152369.1 TrpB-like pyridoxal phosphate-dependent enzyme [Candidatus Bipolaricaulota bacterium]
MASFKFVLPEERIPKDWYNLVADLPKPLPPALNPKTLAPVQPDELEPLFPRALLAQEGTRDRWVPIPEPVRAVYALWRPTPLYRAHRLERALDTPAHLYYKYEGTSPTGSHKPNTAVAQAFYNREEGVRRLTTETGAGQWGSALAFACRMFGLACKVYMVRVSYEQKPYRRVLMETYGAEVVPSPSAHTQAGRRVLAEDPQSPGSLGIAISEAVEDAASREDTKYALGSVLNHVLLHQTVIGEEARLQMELAGEEPDVVIGCVGGGSNFAGLAFPFLRDRLAGRARTRFVAVEPTACPSLTRGVYTYDFGDTVGLTPLLKMHTLGHSFVPPKVHAGGLRYHGMAPTVSLLVAEGIVEARAVRQADAFAGAVLFAQTEGIVPAPEAAHAVAVAIAEALRAREEGQKRVILFNLSGHGYFDLQAYQEYLAGTLASDSFAPEAVEASLAQLPRVSAVSEGI